MKTKPTHKKTIRFIFALCSVLSLGFLTQLNTKPVSAEEEPTITINTISDTAILDLTPTGTEGTFATSVDSDIVFNVSTNNFSGYSLSVTTVDNTRTLVNGSDTIGSIGSALTSVEFNDVSNDNKWGFKPNKFYDVATNAVVDNSGEDGVFLPAPASAALLDKTSAANSTSNSYSISVGMRVNLNATAGEYIGALNIISVANPAAYIINFDDNATAGETITDSPENIDNTTFGSSITLPDNTPAREHYTFTGWCNVTPTNTNGTDACTGDNAVSYQPGDNYEISHLAANNATLYAMWRIDTFTQITKYRFENANGTFTDWTTAEEIILNYGENYSWDQDDITDFDTRLYENDGVAEYAVESDNTNEVTFMRQYYICNKLFKRQKADGTYEEAEFESSERIKKGNSCVYYKGDEEGYIALQITAPNSTYKDEINLPLPYDRQTFTLSFNIQDDVSEVEGGGTYRWGEVVELTAINPDNNSCRTYNDANWWVYGSTPGRFIEGENDKNVSGLNTVHYEVGIGNAVIGVYSGHTDHKQTITFSSPNGDTINFDGTDYHDGDSVQAYCGTYDIVGTITEQPVEDRIYLQDITPATCPTTKTRVYDRRDNESYYIQKLADGNCWLLDNLRLDSATTATLDTSNTNMSPVYNFELPESWPINSGYSYSAYETPRITTNFKNVGLASWWQADSGTFTNEYNLNAKYTVEDSATVAFAEVSRTGVYYNFCAATAGTSCEDHDGNLPEGFVSDGNTYDICPAGWRIPTGGSSTGEYADLRSSYDTIDEFQDALNVRLGSGMVNGVNTQWHPRTIGYYWSRSVYATIYAYYLATWDYGRAEDAFHNRDIGHAVRCMMQIPTEP